MKANEDEIDAALPYYVPQPTDADEAHETLFPTSPFNERPDPNDDDALLMPPLMDS